MLMELIKYPPSSPAGAVKNLYLLQASRSSMRRKVSLMSLYAARNAVTLAKLPQGAKENGIQPFVLSAAKKQRSRLCPVKTSPYTAANALQRLRANNKSSGFI